MYILFYHGDVSNGNTLHYLGWAAHCRHTLYTVSIMVTLQSVCFCPETGTQRGALSCPNFFSETSGNRESGLHLFQWEIFDPLRHCTET